MSEPSPHEKKDEKAMVATRNAVSNNWTVVVKSFKAIATRGTVRGTGGSPNVACPTPLVSLAVYFPRSAI